MTDLTIDRPAKIDQAQDVVIPFCIDKRKGNLKVEVVRVTCESSTRSLSQEDKYRDSSAANFQKAIDLAAEVKLE